MCEFLVKAEPNWMEKVPQEVKDTWTERQWVKYNQRFIVGNPIVVKEDGWKWGKKERPPKYVIIKVPGMTVEQGQQFIKEAFDFAAQKPGEPPPTLYAGRFSFDESSVLNAVSLSIPIVVNSTSFVSSLTDRQP